MLNSHPYSRFVLLFVVTHVCVSSVVYAAPPKINNLSMRGLQIGGTATLVVQGTGLLPDPHIVLGVPVTKQVVRENAADNNVRIDVTLDQNIEPGLYNLRLANANGISSSVVVAVDRLPQRALAESIDVLPVALHGTLSGSTIAKTSFSGKTGQEVIVDVEAQRLGGKLRPVLHLYDSRRRQLSWAMMSPMLSGDARLVAKLPADGRYTVTLHDLQYAAPSPGHYRLKIGTVEYADMVYPPAVQVGKPAKLELIGNVSKMHVEFTAKRAGPIPAPWPAATSATGARPRLIVSEFPELVESAADEATRQLPAAPVAVSGRLDMSGQEDVYRLPVNEGAKLRFDVFADRLGSPIDTVLELRNEKGGRLAQNDDAAGTSDSRIDYTVPKGLTTIDVAVKDLVDRAGPHSIYRLAVTRLANEVNRPDFRLKVDTDAYNVPKGATHVFPVVANRNGYNGPIKIALDNLPAGVQASAADIPAGANGTLVTLSGKGDSAAHVVTAIRGTSVGIDPPLERVAAFESHPLGTIQPWLRNEVGVSLAPANQAAIQIEWRDLPADAPLFLGTKFVAPLRLARPPGAIGPVRLSLVSGQPTLIVNAKPDTNRAIRGEKATVDIPPDPKAQAAAESNIINDSAYTIIVPHNLSNVPYDLAIRAELRSVDNKTVLAQVFTPVRRFNVKNPLAIKLSGEPNVELKLNVKTGAAVTLVGTIERSAGFAGDVTVSITGQPGGVAAPKAVLKPATKDFTLELKFPANFKPSQVKTIKLFATGPPDPKNAKAVVRTEIPIGVTILPAEPKE